MADLARSRSYDSVQSSEISGSNDDEESAGARSRRDQDRGPHREADNSKYLDQNEGKQAAPSSPRSRTHQSVKNKSKANERSVENNDSKLNKKVSQVDKSPKLGHGENLETFGLSRYEFEDERASTARSSSDRTDKSGRNKTKIKGKSVHNKDSRCDKNVQQVVKSNEMGHREERETFQLSFDESDQEKDHSSTAGRPTTNYDELSYDKKSRNNKTKTKQPETNNCDRSLRDAAKQTPHGKSNSKNRTSGNTVENSATRNRGLPEEFAKQQLQSNKKDRDSNVVSESYGRETSESDSDNGEDESERGGSNRMTSEGSTSRVNKRETRSAETNLNRPKKRNSSTKVRRDINRSRDDDTRGKSDYKTNDTRKSTRKKADKSNANIVDGGVDHGRHRASKNATECARGSNEDKTSKESDLGKKKSRNRVRSASSSSCSSASSSSLNCDNGTSSRKDTRKGIKSDVESHSRSSSSSSSDGAKSCNSSESSSNSQGRHRGAAKKHAGKGSKKSHDRCETESRLDTTRTSANRKSKKSDVGKDTRSDRDSGTSRRKDRASKQSPERKETGHKKKKTHGDVVKNKKDRKNERRARSRSDSRGSSTDGAKEKRRDKERYREKGKHGSKYEHRGDGRERSCSSNSDYSSKSKNRNRDTVKKHNKKSRDHHHDRHRRSRERSRERERTPSHDERRRYRDTPKKKEDYRRKSDYYPERGPKYEWQFENEDGIWITYGQSVTGRPLLGANTDTSDDIEIFFSKHQDTKNPSMLINANNNQYLLDFNKMSQTNMKTSVCRRIRRFRISDKQNYPSHKYEDDYHYVDDRDFDLASKIFPSMRGQPQNFPDRKNNSSTNYEWQYEDDSGNWITYGKTNSVGGRNTATSTTSDDIEKYHSSDPSSVTMLIVKGRNQYLLNFNKMTQVNMETLSQRRIRRVPKSSTAWVQTLKQWLARSWGSQVSPGSSDSDSFEWQFQDEHGKWITYGEANSNGITAFSTAATSDDIERYYTSSPDKAPISISSRTHTYTLDFQNMVQINQETLVKRPIRRAKKTSKGFSRLAGVGQSSGNGNNVDVNKLMNPNLMNPSHNPGNFGFGAGSGPQGFHQGNPLVNVGHPKPPSFPCAWQFQDENGIWITYGQPSSTKQTVGSTTTSDDIEQYFLNNPGKTTMIIQSPSNQYVLDKQQMIQINQKTQVQKPVRRIMNQNVPLPANARMQNIPPSYFQQGF